MKMKSKNNEKSIFDINILITQDSIPHTVEDIELVSKNSPERHVLSRNIDIESNNTVKNDMIELIKSGYNLPEADTPENMLCSPDGKKEEKNTNKEADSFKMINLISKSCNLPEIDSDLLK